MHFLLVWKLCGGGNHNQEFGYSPVQLAFWRWVLALAILTPFAWRSLRAEMPVIRQHLPALWIIGVSAYSFYNTFLYLALEQPASDATSIATLQTIFPAVVAILAFILFGGRGYVAFICWVYVWQSLRDCWQQHEGSGQCAG